MANTFINLTGKEFGKWTVTGFVGRNTQNRYMWACECECGNTKVLDGNVLRRGLSKSCGCMGRGRKGANLLDRRFGTLTVVEEWLGERKEYNKGHKHWLCLCDCGDTIVLSSSNLISGINKTCGHRNCRAISRELTKNNKI